MTPSPTYCVLPFIHLEVTNNGMARPCCLSGEMLKAPSGESYSLRKNTLDEMWNSPAMTDLRAALLRGEKPTSCTRCFADESLGIESKRQRDNHTWKHHIRERALPSPASLDLSLGNLCNLKCRICGPHSSSKFLTESRVLFGDRGFSSLAADMKWAEDPAHPAWEDLNRWLATVEHFDIYGGEPFLSKPHFALLERSVELGFAKRQTLHYNTNGTVFPRRMVEEIWPRFKSVNVMFSLDGIGTRFEYQRHGAKWDDVVDNIRRFQEHRYLWLNACHTINVMNIWDFPEFHQWTLSMGLKYWINYLYEPRAYSAQLYSPEAKRRIVEHLRREVRDRAGRAQIEPVIRFLMARDFPEEARAESRALLSFYDKHRAETFSETFPRASELLSGSAP